MIGKNHSRNQQQIHRKIIQLQEDFELLKSTEETDLQNTILKKKHLQYLYDTAVKSLDKNKLPTSENTETEHSDDVNQNPTFVNDSIYWTNQEISDVLTLCIEGNLFEFKDSKHLKNREFYKTIHRELQAMGLEKSCEQMTNKISASNTEFFKIKNNLEKSGEAGMEQVLKKGHIFRKCRSFSGKDLRQQ